MLSSALKSFSSNITANYTISTTPSSISAVWKIYDGKNKKTGKAVSVFVFERKSLEPSTGSLNSRSGGSALKKLHDEVIARIRKESNMLARLRHPSILEIAEPIEDTRNGGLMFATEPVTASLAGLLREKDDEERAGGVAGRPSRFVVEEADGQKRRRELEIDELEIQKGLLQVAQGLEFLHESASLVHGNLTPEAIFVNVKSDWKIAGFGFAGPPQNSNSQSTIPSLSLSEALYHDPRLPSTVQLNLDYTSPDFVMDGNVTTAADMFSMGLLLLALYNSPHSSPIKSNSNTSTYKKLFESHSTTPSSANNFLSSRPLPNELRSAVLPRLIARRPAQRMNAREFQQSQFFDNILVSSIRFLDALPAKSPHEKSQFMRGLPKILDQFPKSVLDKKVLPALLEETKDRDLLYLVLQNIFTIIKILPSAKRVTVDKVLPRLGELFTAGTKAGTNERDTAKEAGLVVVLENMGLIAENCNGKEFKDYILPILHLGLDSPTHAIVDKSLGCLPTILEVLDYSSIKNEVFPTVASVFSRTSSLGIKVRGLEAFVVLCGGSKDAEPDNSDDFSGFANNKSQTKTQVSSVLDKYTVQEKIVPLLKAMKTKEPAVMMAALAVFKQVGKIADADFLALEALPILWSFSLGPLLNLQQFRQYMDLIKELSSKIESEQTKKLRDLSSTADQSRDFSQSNDLMKVTNGNSAVTNGGGDSGEMDFERLVLGSQAKTRSGGFGDMLSESQPPAASKPEPPTFAWSSLPSVSSPAIPQSRTITPDQSLRAFTALSPTTSTAAQSNMQRTMANGLNSYAPMQPASANPWLSQPAPPSMPSYQGPSTFNTLVPSASGNNNNNNAFPQFSIAPPPSAPLSTLSSMPSPHAFPGLNQAPRRPAAPAQKKSGLDAYESLL